MFLQQLQSPHGLSITAQDFLLCDSGGLALHQMVRSNPWKEAADVSERRTELPSHLAFVQVAPQ